MKAVYYSAHFARERETPQWRKEWIVGWSVQNRRLCEGQRMIFKIETCNASWPTNKEEKENGGNIEYEFISDNVLVKM